MATGLGKRLERRRAAKAALAQQQEADKFALEQIEVSKGIDVTGEDDQVAIEKAKRGEAIAGAVGEGVNGIAGMVGGIFGKGGARKKEPEPGPGGGSFLSSPIVLILLAVAAFFMFFKK